MMAGIDAWTFATSSRLRPGISAFLPGRREGYVVEAQISNGCLSVRFSSSCKAAVYLLPAIRCSLRNPHPADPLRCRRTRLYLLQSERDTWVRLIFFVSKVLARRPQEPENSHSAWMKSREDVTTSGIVGSCCASSAR